MMENMCRTCLRMPDKLLPLFDNLELSNKILTISNIKISSSDNLPQKICEECIKNVNLCYNFRKVIRNSDLELRERLAILQQSCAKQEVLNIGLDGEIKNDFDKSTVEVVQESGVSYMEATVDQTINCNERRKLRDEKNLKKRYSLKNMLRHWKKTYKCSACDFTCTELSKWQNHKRTNHYAPGVCNVCGKSVRTDNLTKHIKSHYENPVSCDICGKVLKNSESLRSHSLLHTGDELICGICGKSYRYRGEYNRHLKRHSLNGVKTVKCPICEKTFFDKKSIKQHIQTHTGERPYPCQYCPKRFSSGYAVKTHTRQHTNEKPYICEYCPLAFPQKVSLMTHIKSKHSTSDS